MPDTVVGVRIRPLDKVEYFDANGLELAVGDRVVVETSVGPREARVVIAPGQVLYSDLRGALDPVLRKVDAD